MFSPDAPSASASGALLGASPSPHPPLSSIAERRSSAGEESEEDEDEEGGWRAADVTAKERGSLNETVLMSGYLWKKGERRKTWKKRWFVLRPAHLAFYKTNAEYKLLRLLDLTDVHSCTPVLLKKHANTFGLVSPTRTFYLQAENPQEVQEWVKAISDARINLLSTSTENSGTAPVPIPTTHEQTNGPSRATNAGNTHVPAASRLSQSPHGQHLTSSDSEDGERPAPAAATHASAGHEPHPARQSGTAKDLPKAILSGYLMKCGSRRHNWHKRWFVLNGEKLIYSRSHMDTKTHREVPLAQILDALEYDLPPHRHTPSMAVPASTSPPQGGVGADNGVDGRHTFKVVTTKRTLLLCAPSEEEEIKWLSAVRALIARRSGQGVVPGDGPAVNPAKTAGAPAGAPNAEVYGQNHGHGGHQYHAQGGNTLPGHGAASGHAAAGKRRDSFARRLSLSGGSMFASAGAAPQHALQGQEAASERQS
ncbi:PH-domain-containing protein [Laetiporus sulphureus 93-53]|uniref:PH-domain-containing protein n=1 Tax=Laetiporus sulphureus 93-53 TaxID=1314785 RepID=A0A165C6A1_9APHY|nr:PH-domain-containing protein [Laetiporus sulphureus 93-53]KZT02276.1 PH-domain-containing protein [Laetiporus sulphureus 93-53]